MAGQASDGKAVRRHKDWRMRLVEFLCTGCLTKGGEMVLVVGYATLLLCMAIGVLGGMMLAYLPLACTQPSRVEEIRHLRQAGLAVVRDKE